MHISRINNLYMGIKMALLHASGWSGGVRLSQLKSLATDDELKSLINSSFSGTAKLSITDTERNVTMDIHAQNKHRLVNIYPSGGSGLFFIQIRDLK